MSNYTKSTNFASKDSLLHGNPAKVVKGTEIDTEFNSIQTAIATKLDASGGTLTSGTISGGTISGITDLAVADGGTGASTAADARTNLGALSSVDPSYTGTLTGGTGVINIGSGQVYKDSSGNVGIGVTPSAWSLGKALQIGPYTSILDVGASGTYISSNWYYNSGDKYLNTAAATQYVQAGGAHKWYYAASGTAGNALTFTQAMTLNDSGNLLVNMTSAISSGAGYVQITGATSTQNGMAIKATGSGTQYLAGFYNSSNTVVGSISTNGTTTTYSTSSDYRLKENIAPMTGALSVVQALKPCTYTWKESGVEGQGFIAHELQEVVPDCVTGEKDAVDADGNPVYQGIDTSFLVATLTAAIQEQQAIITQLQADVAALKAA